MKPSFVSRLARGLFLACLITLPVLPAGRLAAQSTPDVRYVDNEFAVLQFTSDSAEGIVTHLDRIEPDFSVLATRSGFGVHTVRDTGLTPGTTYAYRTRVVNTADGRQFTNPPVRLVAGEVQGTLDQSMTWEGTRLLKGQVEVPTNVTLTVAAGAVVELRTNFSGVNGLEVLGRMEARGARFHSKTNEFDGFGFRITSGRNFSPPFGAMILSNCVFRRAYIVAFHELAFGGNTSDLTNDQSYLEWQEVPPGYVMAGENWPGLALRLSPQGAFTASNSVLHQLELEPDPPGNSALVVSDLIFKRRGNAPGRFEVIGITGGTILARGLTTDTNDMFFLDARDCSGADTNVAPLQFLDCTRFASFELRNVTNALVANCQSVPNAANSDNGLYIIDSHSVVARDNRLRGINTGIFSRGVNLVGSRDCTVFGNDIRGFGRAISLDSGSTGNLITSNVCLLNGGSVIFSQNSGGPPTNNTLANNIFGSGNALFLNFTPTSAFSNTWSFPTNPGPNIRGGPLLGGNFWGSAFFGTDTNADGLSDTAFTLRTNNVDFHPLMPDTNLVVNVSDDRPDANADDGEADVDLETPGLQTSLRAALSTANQSPGRKRIVFDLGSATPQMPPFVITITNGPLPSPRGGITIDARTQPNRVLLDGTNRANASGLDINTDTNEIYGLWFRNWGFAGILLGPLADNNIIQQCSFGIDPANPPTTNVNLGSFGLVVQGTGNLIGGVDLKDGNEFGNARQFGLQLFGSTFVTNRGNRILNNSVGFTIRDGDAFPQPNRGGGIELRSGQENILGLPDMGNFIAGNIGRGIYVNNGFGGFARDNFIQGNDIGFIPALLADDPFRLTNSSHGIEIDSSVSNTVVGATAAEALSAGSARSPAGNEIARNGGAGIRMSSTSARGNSWRHNSIHDNRGIGVDLGGTGVTVNVNNDGFQNFPVFNPGLSEFGKLVAGTLVSGAGEYRLEFFGSANPDPTLFGEGATYLGSLPLTIPAGSTSNSFIFPLPADFRDFVSAIALDEAGNASEFSAVYGPLMVNREGDEPDPNLADGLPDVDLAAPGLQTTLRCALQNANLGPGRDVIRFDPLVFIDDAPQILILATLPIVTHPVVLDGGLPGNRRIQLVLAGNPILFTGVETELVNVGFRESLLGGLPGDVAVELVGAHRAAVLNCEFVSTGLQVMESSAVQIGGAGGGQGCTFNFEVAGRLRLTGVLTTGVKVHGNRFEAAHPGPVIELVDAPGNFIGDPSASPGAVGQPGNLFLSRTPSFVGVLLTGAACHDNRVRGNLFSSSGPGGNRGTGVRAAGGAHDNLVGGITLPERNRFSGLDQAVAVVDGRAISILGNDYDGVTVAIDLGDDGPTTNRIPAASTGPNLRQNYPEIQRKSYVGSPDLAGVLRGRPGVTHRLEIYQAMPPFIQRGDGHFHGSPGMLLGVVEQLPAAPGGLALWEFLPEEIFLTGPVMSTATDSEGNTSEFSPVFQEYIVTDSGNQPALDPSSGDPAAGRPAGHLPVVTLRSVLEASSRVRLPAKVSFDFAQPTLVAVPVDLPEVNTRLFFDNGPSPGRQPPLVTLDGSRGSASRGLELAAGSDGSRVIGLGFGGFPGDGLQIATDDNVVDACQFGGFINGITRSNLGAGIRITGADNLIGEIFGNLLAGNQVAGVVLTGPRASGNRLRRNEIGHAQNGFIMPQTFGIVIDGAAGNLIGFATGDNPEAARNYFGHNRQSHIQISGAAAADNVIAGNSFNENIAGTFSLGVANNAVHILNAPRNQVGGGGPNQVNHFASTFGPAIVVEGSSAVDNRIAGNQIGRGRQFAESIAQDVGIRLIHAVGTRIGGTRAGEGNHIGRCRSNAVELLGNTRGTLLFGNSIGIRDNGDSAINLGAGVLVAGSVDANGPAIPFNRIGSAELGAAAGNSIANNQVGILVERGQGHAISGNRIRNNRSLGIDLGGDGPTPNGPDPGDAVAPNHFQDFALIEGLLGTPASVFLTGSFLSPRDGVQQLEIFSNPQCHSSGSGEGASLMATARITARAGTNRFIVQILRPRTDFFFVTTTLTDDRGNTSEFSPCFRMPLFDAADSDRDGIPDIVEDSAFTTADANGDGIPDSQQPNVAQVPSSAGDGTIVVVTEQGLELRAVGSRPPAGNDPDGGGNESVVAPPGVSFPRDLVDFVISGLPTGGVVQATILMDTNATLNSYWGCLLDPARTNCELQRFQLSDDVFGAEITRTGERQQIHLNLADRPGGGDADGANNGSIHHVGGPGLEPFAFRALMLDPGLGLSLKLPSVPGRRYVIEQSRDLFNWTSITQANAAGINISLSTTSAPPTYLRAREEAE